MNFFFYNFDYTSIIIKTESQPHEMEKNNEFDIESLGEFDDDDAEKIGLDESNNKSSIHEEGNEEEENEEEENEEEDDDEEGDEEGDEEALLELQKDFIDDNEDDNEDIEVRRKPKKKKKIASETNNDLDNDDLELLLENTGVKIHENKNKFKRLKRVNDGLVLESDLKDNTHAVNDLYNIFNDEKNKKNFDSEDDLKFDSGKESLNEFVDFIEDDESSDPDNDFEKRKSSTQFNNDYLKSKNVMLDDLSNENLHLFYQAFGDGKEYEWALQAQEIEDEKNVDQLEPVFLDQVFEISELKEKMLTEKDNLIRIIDLPERFQNYRSSINYLNLENEDLELEKKYITDIILLEKKNYLRPLMIESLTYSVGKVVDFISKESLEVPFIWTQRRDYLLFTEETKGENDSSDFSVHILLNEDDLWNIVRLDLEYHSLYEKRLSLLKLVNLIDLDDDLLKDISSCNSMILLNDLQDYFKFMYSSKLKTLNLEKDKHSNNDKNFKKKSKAQKNALYESVRYNKLYDLVLMFGITAKQFGENIQDQSSKNFELLYRIHVTDDPTESPEEAITRICNDDNSLYKDPKVVSEVYKKIFVKEIFFNPKVRYEIRKAFEKHALMSVQPTEKGFTQIDEHSIYYDIKFAINRTIPDLLDNPEFILRCVQVENSGLIKINFHLKHQESLFLDMFKCLKSDGTSEISEKWNKEREIVFKQAFEDLINIVSINVKEKVVKDCQKLVANFVRKQIMFKIDQAPHTPFGFDKGTISNIISLSAGKCDFNSAIVGVYLNDSGKVTDFFKSDYNPIFNPESENLFFQQLKSFIEKVSNYRKPDVIVLSGYNPNSKKVYDLIKTFVESYNLKVNTDDIPDVKNCPLIDVLWGQDETARLYQNSDRAKHEFPEKPSLIKYCIGLARYFQNPLLEYISLGDDILSIKFSENQKLLPVNLVKDAIESSFVDIVNMIGVNINEAVVNPYIGQMLPFVSGLGHRKGSSLIKNINFKLKSNLMNRSDLIEYELLSANSFINCSSFLNITHTEYSENDALIEYLDSTRIHPEDYDLARKMAIDALDLDEEDLTHINEKGGIINYLIKNDINKLDELNLIAYGKELESNFGKKKYTTLQLIKEELVNSFEELRRSFHVLDPLEVFSMLSGETSNTFYRNSVVSVTVVKVNRNFKKMQNSKIKLLKVITPSMISGTVSEYNMHPDSDYEQGQVLQAVVLDVSYENFIAKFSLLSEHIKSFLIPNVIKISGKWDFKSEELEKKKQLEKEKIQLENSRFIQHPLYHNFNCKQAEEFLAPQSLGDCVIRPSSKGKNFLTITWKVANNLFQHILVKNNSNERYKEFLVENRKYYDLDHLIFQYIQAIAKKVEEMTVHPKFFEGNLLEVNEWLDSYTKANPKSSAYVFCFDHKKPGVFLLQFKINVKTSICSWHVKTEVDGFMLKGFLYPNVHRLCNGFKQTIKSSISNNNSKIRSQNQSHNQFGGLKRYEY